MIIIIIIKFIIALYCTIILALKTSKDQNLNIKNPD